MFILFEIERMTGEELAEALSIPLGTVYSRLQLARKKPSAWSSNAQPRARALRRRARLEARVAREVAHDRSETLVRRW